MRICLCGAMRSDWACTSLTHCVAGSCPACVIVGRHIGSGTASTAVGALEYPKKNVKNGNEEELLKKVFKYESRDQKALKQESRNHKVL